MLCVTGSPGTQKNKPYFDSDGRYNVRRFFSSYFLVPGDPVIITIILISFFILVSAAAGPSKLLLEFGLRRAQVCVCVCLRSVPYCRMSLFA